MWNCEEMICKKIKAFVLCSLRQQNKKAPYFMYKLSQLIPQCQQENKSVNDNKLLVNDNTPHSNLTERKKTIRRNKLFNKLGYISCAILSRFLHNREKGNYCDMDIGGGYISIRMAIINIPEYIFDNDITHEQSKYSVKKLLNKGLISKDIKRNQKYSHFIINDDKLEELGITPETLRKYLMTTEYKKYIKRHTEISYQRKVIENIPDNAFANDNIYENKTFKIIKKNIQKSNVPQTSTTDTPTSPKSDKIIPHIIDKNSIVEFYYKGNEVFQIIRKRKVVLHYGNVTAEMIEKNNSRVKSWLRWKAYVEKGEKFRKNKEEREKKADYYPTNFELHNSDVEYFKSAGMYEPNARYIGKKVLALVKKRGVKTKDPVKDFRHRVIWHWKNNHWVTEKMKERYYG